MAEELELSDCINIHELQGMKASSTAVDGAEKSGESTSVCKMKRKKQFRYLSFYQLL